MTIPDSVLFGGITAAIFGAVRGIEWVVTRKSNGKLDKIYDLLLAGQAPLKEIGEAMDRVEVIIEKRDPNDQRLIYRVLLNDSRVTEELLRIVAILNDQRKDP